MTFLKKKIFPAQIQALHPMLLWIREQAARLGFDASSLKKIELASEEALVNIISHGYKHLHGKIFLEISGAPSEKIEIQIADEGSFFNPLLEERKIEYETPLEKRREGGLGIFLIRKYMDEVLYHRKQSKNILILKKRLKKRNLSDLSLKALRVKIHD